MQQKFMVRSGGVEPPLSAPEANVLSTGLRALYKQVKVYHIAIFLSNITRKGTDNVF